MATQSDEIRRLVEEILARPEISALLEPEGEVPGGAVLGHAGLAERAAREAAARAAASAAPAPAAPTVPGPGIFADVDSAVAAARAAQAALVELSLETRKAIITAIRRAVLDRNEDLSSEAVVETGLGNDRDKKAKNELAALKTPGVEDLDPTATSDENGLTITERAPWGVIGAVTPVTNPIATIASNAIGMIAAGNAVVFNVHPNAKRVSCKLVGLLDAAITGAGGPPGLVCAIGEPTIESANELMRHPGVALLVVTGGPGVVAAAMKSGKKAICAGPGNPPCVVDDTADIPKAAMDIVAGAGFDHNVVCICEKEVLAVARIADRLKEEMRANGAYELTGSQIEAVTRLVIAQPGGPGREGSPNKAFVGKSPQYIAKAAGIDVPPETRILLMEVGREHPLVWTEQLMPVLPLVRMWDVDEAIDFAVKVEHGFRHSAMIHSRDIDKLSAMARAMNCSLFVKNGPCYAGLGMGGSGHASFTIASPTGEGITRPWSFTRERRCTLVGAFRIV
jgi:acyl-CoA reductase-like NAD-dependent aldehyde dehydrogenase